MKDVLKRCALMHDDADIPYVLRLCTLLKYGGYRKVISGVLFAQQTWNKVSLSNYNFGRIKRYVEFSLLSGYLSIERGSSEDGVCSFCRRSAQAEEMLLSRCWM